MQEPSDEQLEAVMQDVAKVAREESRKARAELKQRLSLVSQQAKEKRKCLNW